MKRSSFILILLSCSIGKFSFSQQYIFHENMGNPVSAMPITTYSGWQAMGGVQYSGTAELQSILASANYIKASGLGNIYFAANAGKIFRIDQISTEPNQYLFLSFGIYKSTESSNASDFSAEYSVNDVDFTRIPLVIPTGSGTATWSYQTFTLNTSSTSNFYLRFTQLGNATNFRIDDIALRNYIRLPVQLHAFNATANGSSNRLNWTNISELNNAGFQVEHSFDGQTFISIGFIRSNAPGGNSQSPIHYSFTDNNPFGVRQYYRLKQIDLDGKYSFSPVILLQREISTTLQILSVYPNPSHENITLQLLVPTDLRTKIYITDVFGRVLETRPLQLLNGINNIPLDLGNWASGQYLVTVEDKRVRVIRE
ncbi:MAG: T9SS type A sorting domain-containing protein [Bacteroidota bacterium]